MNHTLTSPHALLELHFSHSTQALSAILAHSEAVAAKALTLAATALERGLFLDRAFIEEGALLHDIGICRVHAPAIGCYGPLPYIAHGIAGRALLEEAGLPRHALVCERHIGVGLTLGDIKGQGLPLPAREMVPVSIEERIICLADLFYSKTPGRLRHEKGVAEVEAGLARFGQWKVDIFRRWMADIGCGEPEL
jgi:uncharacterized protein